MSVILDALKKLDREKSIRRGGSPNIAVEILRPDLLRPGKRILPYVVAVSLATAAITYTVMVKFGSLSKSSPPVPVSPPASSQQVLPVPSESGVVVKSSPPPSISPPLPSQPVPPVPLSHEPVHAAPEAISRVPPKIQSQEESKIPAASLSEKKTDQKVISEEVRVAPETAKKPAEGAQAESAQAPRSLRISGIVWSEEPLNRLAVINGASITEGSVIEGVKVVEIFPTHVRFLHNNRPFEIPLGSSTIIKD